MCALWHAHSRRSASWPATPCPAPHPPRASCHAVQNHHCPLDLSPWLVEHAHARQNDCTAAAARIPQVVKCDPAYTPISVCCDGHTAGGLANGKWHSGQGQHDILNSHPVLVRRLDDRVDACSKWHSRDRYTGRRSGLQCCGTDVGLPFDEDRMRKASKSSSFRGSDARKLAFSY